MAAIHNIDMTNKLKQAVWPVMRSPQYAPAPANGVLQAFPFWRYSWFSVTALSGYVTLTFDLSTSKWGHGSPASWTFLVPIFSLIITIELQYRPKY